MSDARCRHGWQLASALIAAIYNARPGVQEKDLRKPSDFDPYALMDKGATGDDGSGDIEVPFDALKCLLGAPTG